PRPAARRVDHRSDRAGRWRRRRVRPDRGRRVLVRRDGAAAPGAVPRHPVVDARLPARPARALSRGVARRPPRSHLARHRPARRSGLAAGRRRFSAGATYGRRAAGAHLAGGYIRASRTGETPTRYRHWIVHIRVTVSTVPWRWWRRAAVRTLSGTT